MITVKQFDDAVIGKKHLRLLMIIHGFNPTLTGNVCINWYVQL